MRIGIFNRPALHRINVESKSQSPYSTEFTSSDSEKKFKRSKKKLGTKWHYYNKKIVYNNNSIGLRSPEIDTITDNNFFIAYGCSHTEGIGIAEDERYSNILSEKLQLKYLNYGAGGTSHNFLWINNILGVKNIKHRPRFVVCQWPEITRITLFNDYKYTDLLTPFSIPNIKDKTKINFWNNYIMIPDFYRSQTQGYFHSINQMWNSLEVPVIHFTIDQESADVLGIKKFYNDFSDTYNLARDLHHPGYKLNLEFAEYIKSEYQRIINER